MIAQVLNRDFVLDQLRAVKADLEAAQREGEAPPPSAGRRSEEGRRGETGGPPLELPDHPEPDDLTRALEEVAAAEAREEESSSGQEGYDPPPSDRRSEVPVPLDDVSFFSRDPIVSLLQSALDEYLELSYGDELESETAVDDRRGGGVEDVAVTSRSLPGWHPAPEFDDRRLFGRFQPADIRWVSSAVSMGIRKFRGRYPFRTTPAEPVSVGPRSRLVLVGDWGSGLPRARKVGGQIRQVLDEGLQAGREQHVVHLGDVYYSGWKREYEKRFLEPWPVLPSEAEAIGSWSLNANHDMYSGGHDYYGHLLADPRFVRQSRSSFFSLVTPDWQIMGLDTGWREGDLEDPQATWVNDAARDSNRKLLLLSHHQLFSVYEHKERELDEKLRPALDSGRVRGWFWGHEHRCMTFVPHAGVAYGRCLGHGGVPVYQCHGPHDPYPAPGNYEYREYLQEGLERWALFGFAVVDFDGPTAHVRYIDENGFEHLREDID
jgi:hypothetical protein